MAAALYRNVLEGEVFEVSVPAVAEMEKILENTFRNINIALANEMAILCNKMGIDYWEVLEAAKTKPYGFMPFYPGPGLGGHCIPIDPYYLTWKAREYKYHTRLIELAGEINNYMPDFVVERTIQMLNRHGKPLKGSNVLLLGVTYKKDIDDIRESPAIEVIHKLEKKGARIWVNDPYISSFQLNGRSYESQTLTEELLASSDIVLITTDHSVYDYQFIANHAKVIFDTRNGMKNIQSISADYEKI